MYDAFLMRIQRRNLAPATPDAVTPQGVDSQVLSAEVESWVSLCCVLNTELARRPGYFSVAVVHRIRI
jgi:hypothetical protein